MDWFYTGIKDELTQEPMEDRKKSCRHTRTLTHASTGGLTAVTIYYGLLNTNAHCESNQIKPAPLDTVAAVALDTPTLCACVLFILSVLVCFHVHPCVHTCNVCCAYMCSHMDAL